MRSAAAACRNGRRPDLAAMRRSVPPAIDQDVDGGRAHPALGAGDPWPQALSTLVDGGFEVLGSPPIQRGEHQDLAAATRGKRWRSCSPALGGRRPQPGRLPRWDTWLQGFRDGGSIDSLNVAAAAAIACYAVTG